MYGLALLSINRPACLWNGAVYTLCGLMTELALTATAAFRLMQLEAFNMKCMACFPEGLPPGLAAAIKSAHTAIDHLEQAQRAEHLAVTLHHVTHSYTAALDALNALDRTG